MTLAFVFPGQGSQTIGMGKDLYQNFAVSKNVFDEIDDALNQKLSALMFDGSFEELTQTQNTQPAIMAVSIAALRAYEEVSGTTIQKTCSFVAGHSLGEYAALCAAGVLTVSETARLLRARGLAMAQAAHNNPGAMAAIIGLNAEQTQSLIQSTLTQADICVVANDNCPGQIVISGAQSAVNAVVAAAPTAGAKKAVILPVSGAFHSPLMQSAADDLSPLLHQTPFQTPFIPIVSNVTARPHISVDSIADNMTRQITGSVRWTESVQFLTAQGVTHFIECGPGKVLSGLIKRIAPDATIQTIGSVDSLMPFSS